MIHHIVDSFCYIIEILYDLIMLSSIAGVHIKEMRHPVISAILYFCLGTFFSSLFPGALGWIILCSLAYLTTLFILNTTIFNSLIAFVISHTFILLIQNSIILLFYRVNFNNQIASSIAGSLITFSIACAICRLLPFHSFYSQLINGRFLSKYLVIHVFLIIMLELGLRKYSTFNTIIYIPLISFFTVIVLITDIVILSQQQIISKQQHDLANYNVYQPMMDDLIEDVTGRQHDFDNILTGIRMLPYTHTDYSSLKEALISSSDEVISEYRTTELLKINMFVIAGFIYNKQKQAEKAHKKLNIVVHSYLLESRMPEYELVRVLGILIDNALEAISEHDSMTLHLDSRDGRIIITTLNKGPLLTPEIRAKLFTAGYTTKTCDRQKHGLGLYNLRRLVFKYNGKIYLENDYLLDDTLVRFEVMV